MTKGLGGARLVGHRDTLVRGRMTRASNDNPQWAVTSDFGQEHGHRWPPAKSHPLLLGYTRIVHCPFGPQVVGTRVLVTFGVTCDCGPGGSDTG